MTAAPLTLHSIDGVRISAGHLPGTDGLCTVLAHGFTGSWRQPRTRLIAGLLNRCGTGVLAIDQRGHGGSGGRSTLGDREILDVDAAVRHARHLGYERVALLGFSMGGAVVIRHAALRGGVEAVVTVSAPARWYYRGTKPMRRLHWAVERPAGRLAARLVRKTRVAGGGWPQVPEAPHEVIGRISPTPLLIVHGDADPYFPLDHPRQLDAAARDPHELWIEPGLGHAEAAVGPPLVRRIAHWINENA